MAMRQLIGQLGTLLAVALLGSALACGDARPVASQQLGTTTCLRCHGQPPETNAHLAHFTADAAVVNGDGTVSGVPHASLACLNCHRDVQRLDGPDHILRADGTPVGRAEVRFDDPESLAWRAQDGATRKGDAGYDIASRTCSNVYCHGAGLKGSTAAVPASIAWSAPKGTVGCGTCHGLPPSDHPAGTTLANCATCHGDAIDAAGKPNPAKHINGTVDLSEAVTSRSCSGCHGDRTAIALPGDPRSAPPTDAEGRSASDPSATAIGAHQNHVVAGVLGAAVACSECHVVPSSIFAAGHFDGQVTVTFGPLAAQGGLSPSYDAKTQTCSNVYCHGNFPFSKASLAALLPPPAPTWNGGAAAVACGSCHDLPPPVPGHRTIDVVAQGCSTSTLPALACHPGPSAGKPGYSFDPATGTGTVDPKLHMDGKVCPPFCGP